MASSSVSTVSIDDIFESIGGGIQFDAGSKSFQIPLSSMRLNEFEDKTSADFFIWFGKGSATVCGDLFVRLVESDKGVGVVLSRRGKDVSKALAMGVQPVKTTKVDDKTDDDNDF